MDGIKRQIALGKTSVIPLPSRVAPLKEVLGDKIPSDEMPS